MWQRTFTTTTKETTAEALWDVLADVNNWKSWGPDLEWTRLNGPAATGKDFLLKPKGGPKTRITIVQCDRPSAFSDLSHLPLCKMRFVHTFVDTPEGVRIEMDLRMSGPLTFLWKKVIGAKQADEFPQHVRALIDAAKQR